MDAAVAAGYYRDGGTPTKACAGAARRDRAARSMCGPTRGCRKTPAEFERDFDAGPILGAKQMLFWEADYIDDRPNAAELKAAMAAQARW